MTAQTTADAARPHALAIILEAARRMRAMRDAANKKERNSE